MEEVPSFDTLRISLLNFQTSVKQDGRVVHMGKEVFDDFLATFQFVIDSYEEYYTAMHKLTGEYEQAEMKRIFKELGEAGA